MQSINCHRSIKTGFKTSALIIALLSINLETLADYRPLQLYEMIIKAEKIVYGKIISLDSGRFTLEIEGSVTGDSGTIVVGRFENWTCASRWTTYKVGQRLFLFLTRWDGVLTAMSGGNEGEMPIQDDIIFIQGNSIPIPPPPRMKVSKDYIYFDVGLIKIYGDQYFGTDWNLEEFIKDVKFIRANFDFEYEEYEKRTWTRIPGNDKLQSMGGQSKLVKWVYREATQ
jgi:hypothetical protein